MVPEPQSQQQTPPEVMGVLQDWDLDMVVEGKTYLMDQQDQITEVAEQVGVIEEQVGTAQVEQVPRVWLLL